MKLRWALGLLGALVLPFLVLTFYLTTFGNGSQRPPMGDFIALAVSVLSGLACLMPMPLKPGTKLLLGGIYAPTMGLMLFGYAFMFVCGYYHDCL